MKKRILSIILTLAMALSLLPASALAAENSFGVSVGGTQLAEDIFYLTEDGTLTTQGADASHYNIYLHKDGDNAYTLTINNAAEHEITFAPGTSLTVVDYSTVPSGNRVTHIARSEGASMVQLADSNVADGTFVVMTSGTTDSTLAPGQTLTLAYLDDDGGYTNACPIQAAETNTADVALLLRGDRGLRNAVTLGDGVALTMAGILYEYTPDVKKPSLTMDFHMVLGSPVSEHFHTCGSLKISAPDDYTDIFNGYDFAEGCTEVEFRISEGENNHPVNTLIRGSIALDEEESVTANDVLVVGTGSTVVTMDKSTGIGTVDGSAIINGALETRGNPGDDDFRALVEIAADSAITVCTGQTDAVKDTSFTLLNGGTVDLTADTSAYYNADGCYLELRDGKLRANGIQDSIITSSFAFTDDSSIFFDLELIPAENASFTADNRQEGVVVSQLSGDVHLVVDEGGLVLYEVDDNTEKIIRAQSHADGMTLRGDGSIWAGETLLQPNADGEYLAGAAHETFTLGGFTLYGNPNGISYDEDNGLLTIHTKGSYEITTPGVTSDTISVEASGCSITLKDVRIEAAAGSALTISSEEISLIAEGSNVLSGGDGASALVHYNMDPLSIEGSGVLTVTGHNAPAVEGSISVDDAEVIATGAEGIYGDVTVSGGSVTAIGTTHAGILGNVSVYDDGSVTATGGSGGNGDDGEAGIDGEVSIDSGSITANGGSAVPGSNGNGGAGVTASVYVYGGTTSFTGGSGSGSGHGGAGLGGDNSWHTSWIGTGASITAAGGSGSGGAAQASSITISVNNAMLDPSEETTAFTLSADENSVRLNRINGVAHVFMYHDEFYEGGGSLIVEDTSGSTHTITINDADDSASLTISGTGSITGETDSVTIISKAPPAPPAATRYEVTAAAENGTVQIDGSRYRRGRTVTFTLTPDAGYVLEDLTVIRHNNAEVKVSESDGVYSFTMPAGNVTVHARFVLAFTDVEADHPFYEAIQWVYQQKLMEGVTETSFDRASPVTRQQVWRVLARLINGEDPGSMAAARDWAVANGIADGTEPGAAAARQEFVTMLWIACGKPEADADVLTQFSDTAAISADASAAMAWAVSEGIVGGYADGTLRPTATATRGAFAAILYRYFAK